MSLPFLVSQLRSSGERKAGSMGASQAWCDEQTIYSKPGAARKSLAKLVACLERLQWEQIDIVAIQLSMEEALVNAIRHGNRDDESKTIRIAYQADSRTVRIEISDQGDGFDPLQLVDPTRPDRVHLPTGRGVFLMRNYMDSVEFNDVGNRVTMVKQRGQSQSPEHESCSADCPS